MTDNQAARVDALVEQAMRARMSGDLSSALAIADRAAAANFQHPEFYRIRAEVLRQQGQITGAGRLLNEALALAPRDALTIVEIGRLHVAEDRVDEAIVAFRAALALEPHSLAALMALGAAHAGRGEFELAVEAYRNVSRLAPQDPDPLASLAFTDARRGQTESARTLAEAALRLRPGHPLAALTVARLDVEARAYAAACDRLQPLLESDSGLNRSQRLMALNLLGDALHGLGRSADAFAAYSRMKVEFARNNSARFGHGGPVENHLSFMNRLEHWFLQQDPQGWARPAAMPASPVRRHVFLLGYLRSGVTLVETVLASLPGTHVIEEEATLNAADLAFLRNDASLSRLNPLDPELASSARVAYWQRVAEVAGGVAGAVLVDMSPLYGIKLPMIAALFPGAVIVQCRRDPRDVVFSCLRRTFKANALSYQLTSLEGIARHYDAAMRLTELHLERVGLPLHVVEYSRLVADFDGVTRELAAFVDVPWTEAARQFSVTAARRTIRTPSASQVRRGLYDGAGQWRAYRAQLEPVLAILEPWITRFGYEP
jgi:tetratricopeptide (TPR) repeat protein